MGRLVAVRFAAAGLVAAGVVSMALAVACSETTDDGPGCSRAARGGEAFALGVPSELDGGVACNVADSAGLREAVTNQWMDANGCELTGSDEWTSGDCTLTRTVTCLGGQRRVTATTTQGKINGVVVFEGELLVENLDADGVTWIADEPCLVRVADESGTVY